MTDLLFVYGTLMGCARSELGCEQRARLAREGEACGPAKLAARLYDLGSYPGVVDVRPWAEIAGHTAGIVHGEVFALRTCSATFAWLDRYEGIDPACAPRCEYTRDLAEVVLASDPESTLRAHVYVYRGALDGARLLKDGRWTNADRDR